MGSKEVGEADEMIHPKCDNSEDGGKVMSRKNGKNSRLSPGISLQASILEWELQHEFISGPRLE